MRINHNIAALNTYRQLGTANAGQSKSMEKLSSGLRINRAGDDAAGLAISEKMRGQIRGLEQASSNAQDGISMIQTAEGALNETHSILQRMRELAVQSSNDTLTQNDRDEIQKEVNQLSDEVNRIANTTEFNTKKLLNGDLGAQTVQQTKTNSNVSSAATGAKVLADGALTAGATDMTAADDFTIMINGVDHTITTTNLKALGSTYDTTSSTNQATVVSKLQEDINNSIGEGKINVSLDTGKLVFTSVETGTGSTLQVKANALTDELNLTFDASTNSSIATGTNATYDVSKTTAQYAPVTTDFTAGGADIAASDTIKLRLNGTNVDLTLAATGNQAHADVDAIVTALNTDIGNNVDLDGKVQAFNDGGKIGFKTMATDSATTVEVVAGGSADATAALGFAKNSTDNNATIHIGANAGQNIKIDINNMSAQQLGLTSSGSGIGSFDIEGDGDTTGTVNGVSESAINYSASNTVSNNGNTEFVLSVSSQDDANNAIEVINRAVNIVSTERSKLGAFQNRLEHTINNLNTSSENLTASESRIRDVDYALAA